MNKLSMESVLECVDKCFPENLVVTTIDYNVVLNIICLSPDQRIYLRKSLFDRGFFINEARSGKNSWVIYKSPFNFEELT